MTSDRWRQVDEIYHAALERPASERDAFLAEACAGDDDLGREVRSLLDQPSMPGFLADPAMAVAAALAATPPATPATGRRIGVYQLQELLGRGGMGEVYRAHDTRLGRDVALKLLPPGFTADVDRLARFTREARLLASLNHPNIGTIHGFEETDPSPGSGQAVVRALVLELVEGDTLADRVARGPLPIPEAFAIARQIADALEAAHDKGIVHRDLKPANIKITPDGVVKVLDFGLAKSDPGGSAGPALANSPTITVGGTEAGLILGTAAYMSPEQARGRAVDKRTDVWAFGCVLYELFTGRAAFPGDTVSDTIGAILNREPDWSALPAALPAAVTTLLHRCLEKDVKKRKRDIGDARAELDDIIARPASATAAPAAIVAASPSRTRWMVPWYAAVVLAGLTGSLVALWPRAQPWQNPLEGATPVRLTNFMGAETAATISPDGKWVAFLSDQTGFYHVWLRQVDSELFRNLTPDAEDLRLSPGNFSLGFTGDGSQIWLAGFIDRPIRLLPFFGGTLSPFLDPQIANVAYSPDGSQLVYNSIGGGDHLIVAATSGANPRRVFGDSPALHNHWPTWSRDGWIYFVHLSNEIGTQGVWRVRPDGRQAEALTTGRTDVGSLAVLDARTLLFVGPDEDGSGPWLWALDLGTKTSRRISSGVEQYTSIAASADGRRLVASVANPRTGLWQVPILDRVAELDDVKPYGPTGLQALAPRLSGDALFYRSTLGTVWRFKDGQNVEIWNASHGAVLEPPSISPDGLSVAFVVSKNRRRTLMVKDVEGGAPRPLAESIDVEGTADWSPESKLLVVGGVDGSNQPGLFIIPAAGGPPVKIVSALARHPAWSNKGDLILYTGASEGGPRVPLLGVRPNGEPVSLPKVLRQMRGLRFLPDDSGVVFLQGEGRSKDFWLLDLGTMKTSQLSRVSGDSLQGFIQSFDVTTDRKIVFDRFAENSDIVLIERPPR